MTANEPDLFDVALEEPSGRRTSQPPNKRLKRDAKFGFGGKKRFSKSGTALSSGDLGAFSSRGGKGTVGGGGRPRLGKSRRRMT